MQGQPYEQPTGPESWTTDHDRPIPYLLDGGEQTMAFCDAVVCSRGRSRRSGSTRRPSISTFWQR